MKSTYIGQAWLVLALAVSFGAGLAGVETWLGPQIALNKLLATAGRIPDLVPGADPERSQQVALDANQSPVVVTVGEGRARSRFEAFRALTKDDRQIGWVIKASGKGFADRIELLIGVDAPVETITGLSILDQKETPGLGNKIEIGDEDSAGFLQQFFRNDPKADRPLVVSTARRGKGAAGWENRIVPVAGATISSKSVCSIVNEAMCRELRAVLSRKARDYNAAASTRPASKE